MRRWIVMASPDGPGHYWHLYEGASDARALVATVCKFVTRWRGYVHAQYSADGRQTVSPPQRSPVQDSAQDAGRWVVEQLAAQRGIA